MLLYVLFYYRGLGLVVISGLVLTAMLLWAIISALGHTSVAPSFDLAGITGLIVSIGITVDSYIVYFERLKDETRSGRSVRTSVDRGFKSAWRTVWAADFVSLLAAIVLYLVAVGNVKGFAFFLGLSTIMDMAITWFYTRPLVILMGQSARLQGSGAFSIATGLGAGPQASAGAPAARVSRSAPAPVGVARERQRRRGGSGRDRKRTTATTAVRSTTCPRRTSSNSRRASTPSNLDEEELVTLDDAARALLARSPKGHGPIARLYRGETRFDFVGKRKIWFSISTPIIVLGIISIILRGGLNLGIEFKGGTEWTIAAPGVTQTQATDALKRHRPDRPDGRAARQREQADAQRAVRPEPAVADAAADHQQERAEGAARGHGGPRAEVDADHDHLDHGQAGTTTTARPRRARRPRQRHRRPRPPRRTRVDPDHPAADKISITNVGPTWGSSITNKAIEALIIFFIVVAIYISIRFEPKMALAAFIAMIHDVLVAIGIYSIFNFQVTPDTVVAILTILGYSLYDTVVVFDRVRDNTKGIGSSGRLTYPQLINLSMNQTLARSINTSMVAIIPVLAVLLIGAGLLGAQTLQSYGLALFVGLLSGAYSSIFIASPVLCMMKEREDRWVQIADRLAKRGGHQGVLLRGRRRQPEHGHQRRRLGPGDPRCRTRRRPATSGVGRSGRVSGSGTGPAGCERRGRRWSRCRDGGDGQAVRRGGGRFRFCTGTS